MEGFVEKCPEKQNSLLKEERNIYMERKTALNSTDSKKQLPNTDERRFLWSSETTDVAFSPTMVNLMYGASPKRHHPENTVPTVRPYTYW